MGYLPVRGDNPRVLASGLSYVPVDKRDINETNLYHLHQCNIVHHEIVRANTVELGWSTV